MPSRNLIKKPTQFPSVFDDFLRPWSDFFNHSGMPSHMLTIPAVNVTENEHQFNLSLAAPGLKKKDFTIDINGNMLTISGQNEENKEEKEENFTRKEYNFSSFTRSFTIPEGVNCDKIEAKYDEGVLQLTLPKKGETKKINSKKIDIK